MNSVFSSRDEKRWRITVVCIQTAVIVVAVIVGGLLGYVLMLSLPRPIEPFAPPKNLGEHDITALPRTASLTCHKDKSSVSVYVYGDVYRNLYRSDKTGGNALTGVVFLHSEKLSLAVVHTHEGEQVFVKGDSGYTLVARPAEKFKGLEEAFSKSFGILGSCYENLGLK